MAINMESIIFASTVSTTPLYNAYQGGTFAFYTVCPTLVGKRNHYGDSSNKKALE